MKLVKVHLIYTSLVMVMAILLVGFLSMRALAVINNFTEFERTFIAQIKINSVTKKNPEIADFAGNTGSNIYFKTIKPNKVFVTDTGLQNGRLLELNIPTSKRLSSVFRLIVDSPKIYVLGSNLPGIITVEPNGTSKLNKFPGAVFTRAVLISNNSFAFRMYEGIDQIFTKGNSTTGELLKENNISERNKDAGISTDGTLLYDRQNGLLVYVYYFKTKILCMDTALNILNTINTINRNNQQQIKAQQVKSKTMITNSSPTLVLNGKSDIYDGRVYVNSKMKSSNELDKLFKDNSVIDIYKLPSGLSEGSFYIPDYKQEKMISFKIIEGGLIAMYPNYIISYKF